MKGTGNVRKPKGGNHRSERFMAARSEEKGDNEDNILQNIVDSVIGVEYLQRSTGKEDLSLVSFLQLKVDLNIQSVLDISDVLPNLTSLVLDDSIMSSIRDLGIGLRCLISLALNSCALNDLDGVGVLTGLQDLSVCDNFITEVSPLAMHEKIQVSFWCVCVVFLFVQHLNILRI